MKNKLFNLAVKVTAVSMVLSMFASALPVKAALATDRSVAISRQKATQSTGVFDVVTFTAKEAIAGDDTTPPILRIALPQTGSSSLDETTISVAVGAVTQTEVPALGTCASSANQVTYVVSSDGQVDIKFCTGSTAITDPTVITVTLGTGSPSLTNPAAGNGTFTLSCPAVCSVTGTMTTSFITDDQVAVSASINQTLTFDVDVEGVGACATSAPGDANTINLSALGAGGVTTSTEHICLKLDTNADGGAVVQVKDANAGLTSTTPAYTIDSASTTLTPGTEGYGLCISATNVVVTDPVSVINKAAPFAVGDCSAHQVGALTTSFVTMANTGGNPASGDGYKSIDAQLKAAIATSTPASTSYTDTLTFRATGTF